MHERSEKKAARLVDLLKVSFVGVTKADQSRYCPSAYSMTRWLLVFSRISGWIYVVSWSISFYPQLFLNYHRKSVAGLSMDFLLGNVLGSFYLFIYYQFMLTHTPTQLAYRRRHEGWQNTIQLNDVVFALHSFIISCVLYLQALYYKKKGEVIMTFNGKVFLSLLVLMTLLLLLLFAVELIEWLDVLYAFSGLKFIITVSKYIPQVLLNYQRKSTLGWSIWNVVLDFTGGTFSIVQLLLDAVISGDITSIEGAAIKLLLGIVSCTFDIFFMFQHYYLYPNNGNLLELAVVSLPDSHHPHDSVDLEKFDATAKAAALIDSQDDITPKASSITID